MGDMGDMGDVFREMTRLKKERHENWNKSNKLILMDARTAGIVDFKEASGGECMLFREKGKPKVDFYPSTGRWRRSDCRGSKAIGGGAEAFLNWYAKQ